MNVEEECFFFFCEKWKRIKNIQRIEGGRKKSHSQKFFNSFFFFSWIKHEVYEKWFLLLLILLFWLCFISLQCRCAKKLLMLFFFFFNLSPITPDSVFDLFNIRYILSFLFSYFNKSKIKKKANFDFFFFFF